ncbi:MAG: polysaccharide deacetylase family protein, partial [Lachnospiraceae bacterium]|nr:polysaccharide deacetylase family protein [Lachnospiraceae bacterium]
MTREELFAKREQKLKEQRKRRLIMIGGVIAALLLVFLIVKIATGRVSKKNGPDSSVQTTNEAGASAATTVSRTTESQTPTPTQAGTDPAAQTADVTAAPAAQTVDETAAADDTAVQGMTEYTEQGAAGWNDGEGGRWYKTASGQQYMNGWKMLDGSRYFFKADGYAAVGWEMADDGNMYYFNEDGSYNPDKKKPMLALTFDDGPGQYTMELLECLEANGAHATFFMLGELV